MKITIVADDGDGPTGIYVDGKLFKSGDYYHDKISDWAEGFVAGLKHAGKDIEEEQLYASLSDDEEDAYFHEFPELWEGSNLQEIVLKQQGDS
jgi:hypothetical protein